MANKKERCGTIKFTCLGTGGVIDIDVFVDDKKIYIDPKLNATLARMPQIPTTPVLQLYSKMITGGENHGH